MCKLKLLIVYFFSLFALHVPATAWPNKGWDDPVDPIISVKIAATSYSALLDTGANVSIVRERLIEKLDISITEDKLDVYFPSLSKTVTLYRTQPFEVTYPDTSVTQIIRPLVYPKSLSDNARVQLLANSVAEYDLLLGMEDLWRMDFDIDYKEQISRIFYPDNPIDLDEDEVIYYGTDVMISGIIVNCLMDTGAWDMPGIFIHANHPKYEKLRSKFENFLPMSESFSSSGESLVTHDPTVRVHNFSGKGALVQFEVPDYTKEVGNECYIGSEVLSKLVFKKRGENIDYSGKLPPVSYNRMGFSEMQYNTVEKTFILAKLFPHGALAKAGVKEGDILISIDEVLATLENIDKLKAKVRQAADTELKIVIQSQSLEDVNKASVRNLTIILADVLVNQPKLSND